MRNRCFILNGDLKRLCVSNSKVFNRRLLFDWKLELRSIRDRRQFYFVSIVHDVIDAESLVSIILVIQDLETQSHSIHKLFPVVCEVIIKFRSKSILGIHLLLFEINCLDHFIVDGYCELSAATNACEEFGIEHQSFEAENRSLSWRKATAVLDLLNDELYSLLDILEIKIVILNDPIGDS